VHVSQPAASQPAPTEVEEEGEEGEVEVQTADGRVKSSPVARKVAEERGIDLRSVKRTGPGGRIVKRDVEAAQKTPAASAATAPAPAAAPAAQPKEKPSVPQVAIPMPAWQAGQVQAMQDEKVALSKLRAIIGRRMSESNQNVPDFSVVYEYKMDKVMQVRKEINELLPQEQKLSVNDFIIKASAYALRQFPNINASLGENEIVRHGHVNVGVAVAVPTGLLTVVCKDADQKPLRVIAQEVKEMVARARDGKVRPEDIEGSTFSISNLGMFNVDEFVAIINPPEAAILAVGAVKEVPVVEDGQVKVGSRMKLTLSADHRVTDGAEAAQFMQALALYLEEPMRLVV
jgi:pyruvate dehydrogenase E2 component (dihydrolipoamide acetyltransferase)